MKKNIFRLVLTILIATFPLCTHASAYMVYLFYNVSNKTLSFDKAASNQVILDDSTVADYIAFSKNKIKGEYILKLYDINDFEIISTEFKKQNGSFILEIPYFSLANKIRFFEKDSAKEILQADLSSYLTCNGNGICEIEKKENITNCIGDCGKTKNTYSEETRQSLEKNNGTIKEIGTGEIILKDPSFQSSQIGQTDLQNKTQKNTDYSYVFAVILVIIIALFLSGFIFYRRFIKK